MWSSSFGTVSDAAEAGVAVDRDGDVVLLTGSTTDEIDFGGGPLVKKGMVDVAMAKFDASGKHLWSKRFGGPLANGGAGLAVDLLGNVLLTGYSVDSGADFGGGALPNAGSRDVFVASLAP